MRRYSVPRMPLASFEDTQLPLYRLNQTPLLIKIASLLIQLTTQIIRSTELSFPRGAETIKLFKSAHTTP
jgi:hypothetical protein